MKNHLRLPRWNDILLEIYKNQDRNNYCQRLNRNIRGSISHLREVVRLLAKSELINIERQKKIKRLILTEKGQKVTLAIMTIKSALR
jgi:predicted transcriptional regulator